MFAHITGTKSDSLIHLKASQGVITSPDANDDGLYDLNVDILWIIEASDGEIIRFNVIFALIRLSDYCEPDGLKVWVLSFVQLYVPINIISCHRDQFVGWAKTGEHREKYPAH